MLGKFEKLEQKIKGVRDNAARISDIETKKESLLQENVRNVEEYKRVMEAIDNIDRELKSNRVDPAALGECVNEWNLFAEAYNKELGAKVKTFMAAKKAMLEAYLNIAEFQCDGLDKENRFVPLISGIDSRIVLLERAPKSTDKELFFVNEQAAPDYFYWLRKVMKEQSYTPKEKDSSFSGEIRAYALRTRPITPV